MPEGPMQNTQAIRVPDLMRSKYFQSEHGGTEVSEESVHSEKEEEAPPPKPVKKVKLQKQVS
jgi:hypothetical protein